MAKAMRKRKFHLEMSDMEKDIIEMHDATMDCLRKLIEVGKTIPSSDRDLLKLTELMKPLPEPLLAEYQALDNPSKKLTPEQEIRLCELEADDFDQAADKRRQVAKAKTEVIRKSYNLRYRSDGPDVTPERAAALQDIKAGKKKPTKKPLFVTDDVNMGSEEEDAMTMEVTESFGRKRAKGFKLPRERYQDELEGMRKRNKELAKKLR